MCCRRRQGSRGPAGAWSFGVRPPLRDEALRPGATGRRGAAPSPRPRAGADGEFSVGGSLTWYLACQEPGKFAAFAPMAGGFWRRHPSTCAGPVKLLHAHGWRDQTVPLEGRPLRAGLEQGDIFEGLQLWRRVSSCTECAPTGSRPIRYFGAGRGTSARRAPHWSWCCSRVATKCRRAGRRRTDSRQLCRAASSTGGGYSLSTR